MERKASSRFRFAEPSFTKRPPTSVPSHTQIKTQWPTAARLERPAARAAHTPPHSAPPHGHGCTAQLRRNRPFGGDLHRFPPPLLPLLFLARSVVLACSAARLFRPAGCPRKNAKATQTGASQAKASSAPGLLQHSLLLYQPLLVCQPVLLGEFLALGHACGRESVSTLSPTGVVLQIALVYLLHHHNYWPSLHQDISSPQSYTPISLVLLCFPNVSAAHTLVHTLVSASSRLCN